MRGSEQEKEELLQQQHAKKQMLMSQYCLRSLRLCCTPALFFSALHLFIAASVEILIFIDNETGRMRELDERHTSELREYRAQVAKTVHDLQDECERHKHTIIISMVSDGGILRAVAIAALSSSSNAYIPGLRFMPCRATARSRSRSRDRRRPSRQ